MSFDNSSSAELIPSADALASYPAATLSTSLLRFRRTQKSDQRTELKYLLTPEQAEVVRSFAREHLAADDWCDQTAEPGECDSYKVNTLYLDTPRLDIFHGDKVHGRRKYRLRRYGNEATIWLESKKKRKKIVRKLRTPVPESEVAKLAHHMNGEEWHGDWFLHCVLSRPLTPVAVVQYQRFAWLGNLPDGRLRLTIDTNLRGQPARGWHIPSGEQGPLELLPGGLILELKFRGAMPALAKELFYALPLTPASFSKYRTAVAACGLAPSADSAASA